MKRISTGWYTQEGSKYDYEVFNEDGWQLMVYRSGTMAVLQLGVGGDWTCTGMSVYAVTHATKADAVGHMEAIESGEYTVEGGYDQS